MNEFEENILTFHLDDDEKSVLIVRVQTYASLSAVRSFAIIFTHIVREKPLAIVKIDGSEKERINIHYFFKKPPQKEYHNRPLSIETIDYYINEIRENWRWYLAQYKENYI